MKGNIPFHAFNRGLASPKALARVDVEKLRLSAERQENFIPRVIGSMTLRPGLEFIAETRDSAAVNPVPFIYSNDDVAILEFSAFLFRPLVDNAPIVRPSVSTAVTSGTFSSGTGWTFTGFHGGSAAISVGELVFSNEPIDSYATATQTLTIASGDQNVEHGLRIQVTRGPVLFKVGASSGGEEYISQITLKTGYHSLAFTPTGSNAYIQFESHVPRETKVTSCTIEAAGNMELTSPYAAADLKYARYAQSGDIVFMDCRGYRPYQIERRSARSWSLVEYDPIDGPFFALPTEDRLKFSIDNQRGMGVLTASRDYFTSAQLGVMYRIFTPGYNLTTLIGKEDAFTPPVRVNGVGAAREVSIVTSGTWAGTLTVQISYIGADSGFANTATTITTNATTAYKEPTDNTAVWVRVGFKEAAYTSGLAEVQITFGAGGGGFRGDSSTTTGTSPGGVYGVCRVLEIVDATTANVEILSYFSSSIKSDIWQESQWSDGRGWPSSVAFYEGRLFHAGQDQIIGSISDGYVSFDPEVTGDAGPIQRSIGYGPVQYINWLLPLSRLVIGGDSSEIAIRSSSFDEPLTPTNFSLKDISTNGTAASDIIKVDQRGVFVDRSLSRIMEIFYSVESQDYTTNDLTQIIPDENVDNPIVRLVVQRKPDTRIHCIRQDGTALCLLYEPRENTLCWYTVVTDGFIENAVVLPEAYEDAVFYIVRRIIGGSSRRYYEKWAQESECLGGSLNKQADSFVSYTGSSTTFVGGLSHLEGESVVLWGDGKDLGTATVSGGQVTFPQSVTNAVVGLPYDAYYKSAKLAYGAQMGTALTQRKRVNMLGLMLYNTHYQGLQMGQSFDNLRNMPLVVSGAEVASDTIHENIDMDMIEIGGEWSTDSRVCLKASAPRPATVVGLTLQVSTHERN